MKWLSVKISTNLNTVVSIMVCLIFIISGVSYYYLAERISSPFTTTAPIRVSPVHKISGEEPLSAPKLGAAIPEPSRPKMTVASGSQAPVVGRISTSQKVVFLTIDDGGTKNSNMLQLLQDNNIKASLFLDNKFIADNYDFFRPFQAAGMRIQNHGLNHIYAKPGTISYEAQKSEICGMANKVEQIYGVRPTLYRPPGGYYDDNTKVAAKACGMNAVVMWIAKANGGSMQYQIGSSLRPGDIVLMHFRPEFAQDLGAFIQAANNAGLTTDYLENWI
jgi:peptidoglycan/xylan/chitin deacetylase (PgdA/CDA1 family)